MAMARTSSYKMAPRPAVAFRYDETLSSVHCRRLLTDAVRRKPAAVCLIGDALSDARCLDIRARSTCPRRRSSRAERSRSDRLSHFHESRRPVFTSNRSRALDTAPSRSRARKGRRTMTRRGACRDRVARVRRPGLVDQWIRIPGIAWTADAPGIDHEAPARSPRGMLQMTVPAEHQTAGRSSKPFAECCRRREAQPSVDAVLEQVFGIEFRCAVIAKMSPSIRRVIGSDDSVSRATSVALPT